MLLYSCLVKSFLQFTAYSAIKEHHRKMIVLRSYTPIITIDIASENRAAYCDKTCNFSNMAATIQERERERK